MTGKIKIFAKKLSRFPALKRFAKFMYQLILFIFNFHRNRYQSKFKVEKLSGEAGGFFGYYDKCPESQDGKYVIFHTCPVFDANAESGEVAIVLLELSSGKYENIFKTSAYNFQIGSRLQWIDEKSFIFNIYDISVADYVSLIYNVSTQKFRKLLHPVFDVCNGKYLFVNFIHLTKTGSEYGYPSIDASGVNVDVYIKIGDFQSDDVREIVNLDMIAEQFPHIFESATGHHFNHLMFSPDGSKFVFILRWHGNEGKKEFLMLYENATGKISILNTEMTSHYCWVDNYTLLGYMSHLEQPGFYYLDILSGKFNRLIINEQLGDGHPSVKNELILVDSYPDAARMQQLMIVSKGKVLHVGNFYAPITYHERYRCDLHPRFNSQGDTIYIDSKHDKKRHLYRIKLKGNE